MSQSLAAPPGPLPSRRRHRSRARKLLESLALFIGAPLLLLAVLALAVDLIEYRPVRPTPASQALPPAALQQPLLD